MYKKFFLGSEKGLAARTFFWTAASGTVYALSSFIFLAVITHVLGDTISDIFSIGLMIAQQVLTVGKFSVRNYQVSDIKEKYSFSQYLGFRLVTCLIMLVITAGWIIFGGYRGDTAIVIVCMTVYKLAECISDVFEGLYQQKFRFDVSGKSQFFKNLIMIITFVAMIIISRNLVLSSVVLAVESMVLILVVDVPLTKFFDRLGLDFKIKKMWGIAVACFSLFVSSFLYVYINNSPKYAISDMGGDSALTHFNALFMPVFAVDLLAGFTMRMWLTKMTVYHEEGNYRQFKKMIWKQCGIIALITLAAMAGMYFLGGFILSLIYGIDLSGYEWTNALLMLSGGLVAVYTLFENVIIIYRKQHFSIVINIISALAAVFIVPACTRYDGIMGASVGYLAVNAIRALGYYFTALFYMLKGKKKQQG